MLTCNRSTNAFGGLGNFSCFFLPRRALVGCTPAHTQKKNEEHVAHKKHGLFDHLSSLYRLLVHIYMSYLSILVKIAGVHENTHNLHMV